MHSSFLKAVLAAPSDDAPRLVYADWLEEQGDPRGEFIRAQCALAGGQVRGRELAHLREREDILQHANHREWSNGVHEFVDQYQFHRGFVNHVLVGFPDILESIATLRELAPLESVAFRRQAGFGGTGALDLTAYDLQPLLELSPQLEALSIAVNGNSLQRLIRADVFRSLITLDLEYSYLSGRNVESLLGRNMLRLQNLSLRGAVAAGPDDAGLVGWVRGLVQSNATPSLQSIDVRDCLLDEMNLGLLRSRFGPGLRA